MKYSFEIFLIFPDIKKLKSSDFHADSGKTKFNKKSVENCKKKLHTARKLFSNTLMVDIYIFMKELSLKNLTLVN